MTKTLFRWAGGKTKMIKHFQPYLNPNGRTTYVEPFFGAGAVFQHMQTNYRFEKCVINDVNPYLMKLFEQVKTNLQEFEPLYLNLLAQWRSLPFEKRKSFYYETRTHFLAMEESDPLFYPTQFFLMQTCFNGLWKTMIDSGDRFASACGLTNRQVPNIDLAAWESLLQNSEIKNGTYSELDVPENSFVFCDPPYRDCSVDYKVEFDDTTQLELVEWCRKLHKDKGCKVLLCNKEMDDNFFSSNASDAKHCSFDYVHTAGRGKNKKSVKEILMVWE